FGRVDSAPGLGFQPLRTCSPYRARGCPPPGSFPARRKHEVAGSRAPAGDNLGLDMGYKFADKLGSEPEEIYFRYYLRLASDWRPSPDGGKLPGISATYGNTGWGGRKADGRSGWSMRGIFFRSPEAGSPYHELTPI